MWSFRLNQEMKVSATAHFVTLTYSDENIPYLNKETGEFERGYSLFKKQTLYYTDIQLYLKRLRKLETKNTYIKFFCAGETGTQNDRVHWHLIIFNASEKNIRKAWLEQGIVDCGKADTGDSGENNEALHPVSEENLPSCPYFSPVNTGKADYILLP